MHFDGDRRRHGGRPQRCLCSLTAGVGVRRLVGRGEVRSAADGQKGDSGAPCRGFSTKGLD